MNARIQSLFSVANENFPVTCHTGLFKSIYVGQVFKYLPNTSSSIFYSSWDVWEVLQPETEQIKRSELSDMLWYPAPARENCKNRFPHR